MSTPDYSRPTVDAKTIERLRKPERRAVVKKRTDRQRKLSRAQCREIVYNRESMRCQRCGKRCKPWNEAYPGDPDMAHVNEPELRSKGADATNPDECELVCGACHMPNGEHAPTVERMQQIRARKKTKKRSVA